MCVCVCVCVCGSAKLDDYYQWKKYLFFCDFESFLMAHWNSKHKTWCEWEKNWFIAFLFATTIIITTHLHSIYYYDENLYGPQCPVFIICQTFQKALFQQTRIKTLILQMDFFSLFSSLRPIVSAGECKAFVLLSLFGWIFFFPFVDSISIAFHKNANPVSLGFRCFYMVNAQHWT